MNQRRHLRLVRAGHGIQGDRAQARARLRALGVTYGDLALSNLMAADHQVSAALWRDDDLPWAVARLERIIAGDEDVQRCAYGPDGCLCDRRILR